GGIPRGAESTGKFAVRRCGFVGRWVAERDSEFAVGARWRLVRRHRGGGSRGTDRCGWSAAGCSEARTETRTEARTAARTAARQAGEEACRRCGFGAEQTQT